MTTRVIEWDAARLPENIRALLPEGLRDLPPGQYLIEPIEDDVLTPEEMAGLEEAIDQAEAGDVVPLEEVVRELREQSSLR